MESSLEAINIMPYVTNKGLFAEQNDARRMGRYSILRRWRLASGFHSMRTTPPPVDPSGWL